MKDNWAKCLAAILQHEGGYVNHPSDPGGETNKGITKAVYDAYRKSNGQALRSVKAITTDEISDIYRKNYWDKVSGDDLPSGVDLAVFDFAVNSGVSRSAKFAQAIVGLKQDGLIGPATVKAIRTMDPTKLINQFCDNRLAFLTKLDTFPVFGRGWTKRVEAVRLEAKSMVNGNKPLENYEAEIAPSPKPNFLSTLINFIISIFTRKR